ncbi:MAG: hypothetical protein ACPGVO_04805 [Spirulinaceae cyanobacterium]
MAMTDDELRALSAQILEVQRDLQESQLQVQQQLGELTANTNKLERIVLRYEGYHILSESERLDLQGQMLELQRRVRRLEQRENGDGHGAG